MSWDDVSIAVTVHGRPPIEGYDYRVVDGALHCAESCVWCGGEPMTEIRAGEWQCPVGARLTDILSDASKGLDAAVLGSAFERS